MTKMIYQLKYGKDVISFSIPEELNVTRLNPPEEVVGSNEKEIITQALANPINSDAMEKIVRKGEKTCIVVPDRTRVCQASVYLPEIISRLNQCGIQDEDITILMANGSHRANTPEEVVEIVGKDIFHRIKIIEHDYADHDSLVHLGETKNGTPVFVNRHLVQAERVILTGGVLHHYFAGFGGGPKMVVPGNAGIETIVKNHSFTIHPYFPALHPACFEGNTEDNPVHSDIRDALKFITVDFILNVVTNSQGKICQAFAGELFAAHRAACQSVHQLHSIGFDKPADLVIVSANGYPKDLHFIQVHKALHHAYAALKPGGTIILLAKCDDGIGSKTFLEWFDNDPDLKTMHLNLLQNFKINGNTALSLKMKTDTSRIFFMTELDRELVKKLGMMPVTNLSDVLDQILPSLNAESEILIITDGSTYLPVQKLNQLKTSEEEMRQIIHRAEEFTQEILGGNKTGHGWWHAQRVRKLARTIAFKEGGDLLIIELAALLHDIIDRKNLDPVKPYQRELVKDWLRLQQIPGEVINHVCEIIDTLSFKGAHVQTEMRTLEGKIVQDADRLEALGAIGIARTLAYGGEKHRPIFDPNIKPEMHQSEEAYHNQQSTSINHFYEKLLLVKDRLNTKTAQKIGSGRHEFTENFLNQFLIEWDGKDLDVSD